jgi:adenylyltransferase/sulfurtransferase
MGVLQALETIKMITRGTQRHCDSDPTALAQGVPVGDNNSNGSKPAEPPSLLLFSAFSNPPFRYIRLRTRKPKCNACSAQATISREVLSSGSLDYAHFCGALSPVDALSTAERVSAQEYSRIRGGPNVHTDTQSDNPGHILVDVREKVQFELCSLGGSINIPYSTISRRSVSTSTSPSPQPLPEEDWVKGLRNAADGQPIYVVCRLGNDSQLAVGKMKEFGLDGGGTRWIGDIRGGLRAWNEHVDPEFPEY